MLRIQTNILAGPERRALTWLCGKLAGYVSSDQLTLLGMLGGGLVLMGYVAGRTYPALMWFSVLGYLLHWFGDSLDGSMARHTGQERPRYGYFLDHSVDAFGNLMIMLGLGLTHYVRMDISLFALTGYLLLSIHVFLKQQALGQFQLSFLVLGPTELRIVLVSLTLGMMYWGSTSMTLLGFYLSIYDLIVGGGGVILLALFAWCSVGTALVLRKSEN